MAKTPFDITSDSSFGIGHSVLGYITVAVTLILALLTPVIQYRFDPLKLSRPKERVFFFLAAKVTAVINLVNTPYGLCIYPFYVFTIPTHLTLLFGFYAGGLFVLSCIALFGEKGNVDRFVILKNDTTGRLDNPPHELTRFPFVVEDALAK